MKCPIDGTDLVMSDRQNVEIDYCPQCRGVWLDRGELDKIIQRVESEGIAHSQPDPQPQAYRETYQPQTNRPPSHSEHREYRDYDDDNHGKYGRHGHKKHKESWLGDIFG